MYSYEEALSASLDYFNGDELVASTFLNKYALKDKQGNLHERTPHDMHNRLAHEFARIEKEKYNNNYEQYFKLYRDALDYFRRIVPQGSPMTAIGNPFQIMSASNCVVVDSPHDSIEGIMNTACELAQLYKRRAGVGVDVSTLRPNGFSVNNAARATTGPVSFMALYSYLTTRIAQKGRRGALMMTISVHHPDVEEFAACKEDKTNITGANISVRLTDEFLKAVDEDGVYEQRWPCEGEPKFRRLVPARKVWDTIIKYATETADPGLMFWDRIISQLPSHNYPGFKTLTTNPCGEIPLPVDSCRLISVNLTGYVKNAFKSNAYFDIVKFTSDVKIALRMCDNLVDLEIDLIERIIQSSDSKTERELWRKLQQSGQLGRRVGLGTHGEADMFAQLCIPFDSDGALKLAKIISSAYRDAAYESSVSLARERGPFPIFNWEIDKDNDFIKSLPPHILSDMQKYGRRNIALLTRAPTGTTSMMSRCGEFFSFNISSGGEPVFRNSYMRRKRVNPDDKGARVDYVDGSGESWMQFEVYHGNVMNWATTVVIDGQYPSIDEALRHIPSYFVTSDKIDWRFRVDIQGIWTKAIDHSISSTLNLPMGTSRETVGEIYLRAWRSGLKGVTVYVEGSKDGVLVSKDMERPKSVVRHPAPKRPKELCCDIHWLTYKGKRWLAAVGTLNGEPYEMFACSDDGTIPHHVKNGRIVKTSKGRYALETEEGSRRDIAPPEFGWATRLISTSLRHGVPIDFLVEQLNKDGTVVDLNRVLARVLKKYVKDGKVRTSTVCPECSSSNIEWKQGCMSCIDCGYFKCD